MMFSLVLALSLLALSSGVALLIWSMRNDGPGTTLAKNIGYLVIIVSILTVIFAGICSMKMKYKMEMRHQMMMEKMDMMRDSDTNSSEMTSDTKSNTSTTTNKKTSVKTNR